uniref:Uncharacterized protein n=1 Tax=Arundo donax TaxID=35708 RepID=A0A0A9F6V8_ARUDO
MEVFKFRKPERLFQHSNKPFGNTMHLFSYLQFAPPMTTGYSRTIIVSIGGGIGNTFINP